LIRKEHVRCRYGVFKVRACSSTPCGKAAGPQRGPPIPQSSTAYGSRSQGSDEPIPASG
jgi:hypothetical protein